MSELRLRLANPQMYVAYLRKVDDGTPTGDILQSLADLMESAIVESDVRDWDAELAADAPGFREEWR